ncbi:MAG TPA: 2-oxo acid dehydrogenase subunit E2 [Polyangia bacterium]|jgi:pyruvate dehydrogenase E2 component (dihydrolipoamide acetyltransferase)|nr:2-oxo acid dehydrogenase subunit E2 [Polyangia bacterium]
MVRRNVQLGPPLRISSWRKISLGSWRPVGDSSVYGMLEIEAEPALRYVEAWSRASAERVTLTHLGVRACGVLLRRHPEINAIIRFGRIYPRTSCDVFTHAAADPTGQDLTGVVVRAADGKSVAEIAAEINPRLAAIKQQTDQTFARVKGTMRRLPGLLSRPLLDFLGFLLYSLNLWSPLLGAPRDSFGSMMLTNIGSLGLKMAFVPIAPYTRIPLVLAMGAVHDRPIVRGDRVVPAKVMCLCFTFDHRIIDGVHAAQMARTLEKIFADPYVELGAPVEDPT